jgi:hypothetical protein
MAAPGSVQMASPSLSNATPSTYRGKYHWQRAAAEMARPVLPVPMFIDGSPEADHRRVRRAEMTAPSLHMMTEGGVLWCLRCIAIRALGGSGFIDGRATAIGIPGWMTSAPMWHFLARLPGDAAFRTLC